MPTYSGLISITPGVPRRIRSSWKYNARLCSQRGEGSAPGFAPSPSCISKNFSNTKSFVPRKRNDNPSSAALPFSYRGRTAWSNKAIARNIDWRLRCRKTTMRCWSRHVTKRTTGTTRSLQSTGERRIAGLVTRPISGYGNCVLRLPVSYLSSPLF